MQTLANLMQYVNSTMASQLLQNSDAAQPERILGGYRHKVQRRPDRASWDVGPARPFNPFRRRALALDRRGLRRPSRASLHRLRHPVALGGCSRRPLPLQGRVIRIIGSQSLPGITLLRGARDGGEGDSGSIPTDPRKRIEFYFGRAVRLMSAEGGPQARLRDPPRVLRQMREHPGATAGEHNLLPLREGQVLRRGRGEPRRGQRCGGLLRHGEGPAMKLRQFLSIMGVVALVAADLLAFDHRVLGVSPEATEGRAPRTPRGRGPRCSSHTSAQAAITWSSRTHRNS